MFWNWSFNDTKTRDNIYPVMEARIKELLQEKLTGLNANGNKVKSGTKTRRALLIKKRDAPPELSETAKAFVRKFG
jgi:hypothetical protein